jgi:hypothetical protein
MRDLDAAAGFCRACDPAELAPGQRAAWAAITAATGRPEVARSVARSISPEERLFAEERILLASIPEAPVRSVARH